MKDTQSKFKKEGEGERNTIETSSGHFFRCNSTQFDKFMNKIYIQPLSSRLLFRVQ